MSADEFTTFLDYKAIIELKARFGRLVDAQDWEGWIDVFTDDCVFDLGAGECMTGGRSFAEAFRPTLETGISVHRAYMPEIDFISAEEAKGVWAVNDYAEYPLDPETGSRTGQMGYGREYETYRKVDGKWKIAHWRLRYDRIDPLPREPLPKTFLGGPEVMQDEDYLKSVINPRGT